MTGPRARFGAIVASGWGRQVPKKARAKSDAALRR